MITSLMDKKNAAFLDIVSIAVVAEKLYLRSSGENTIIFARWLIDVWIQNMILIECIDNQTKAY